MPQTKSIYHLWKKNSPNHKLQRALMGLWDGSVGATKPEHLRSLSSSTWWELGTDSHKLSSGLCTHTMSVHALECVECLNGDVWPSVHVASQPMPLQLSHNPLFQQWDHEVTCTPYMHTVRGFAWVSSGPEEECWPAARCSNSPSLVTSHGLFLLVYHKDKRFFCLYVFR